MDKKIIAVIALVVIIAVAAVAAFVILSGDNSGSSDNSLSCKLRVYGNANMDNYLDEKDVTYIQDIIDGKTVWNRDTHPLVDANNDGVINTADIALVKKFIAGSSTTMYYLDQNGEVRSVPYPLTNVLGSNYGICTEWTTGIDMAIILGLEDRVTYIASSDVNPDNLDPKLYPTASKMTKFAMRNPNLAVMWNDGVRILLGDHPRGFGSYSEEAASLGFTIVKLPLNRYVSNVGPLDTLITLGVMFNKQDSTKSFIEFTEKSYAELEKALSKSKTNAESYVIPYIAPEYESFWIDAHGAGPMTTADVVLIDQLPMISKITTTASDGFDEVTIDMAVAANPDVFISAMYAFATDKNISVSQYKQAFKTWMEYGFDKSTAGKNGMLFAVPFEDCSLPVYATAYILASMVWSDINSDTGWKLLQEYYDNFTHFSGDVKNSKFAPLSYEDL
jgi:ABC-type Fe3+-hydroxamate transport system substrate-binding protein